MTKNKKIYGPDIWQRDENGLIKSVDHEFNKDGSVNWRAMVDPKHLYPNRDWFESRKKQAPESIEGLEDHQLLIKLSGIKEVAKLRGIDSVDYVVLESSEDRVVAKCNIKFSKNYENTEGAFFGSIANATLNNTNGFAAKFLECIAENRAFVRAVRNFLGIHIVGADEIDTSKDKAPIQSTKISTNKDISPQGILKERMKGKSFKDLIETIRKFYSQKRYSHDPESIKSWKSWEDVPAKECRKLMKLIKEDEANS